MTISNIGSVSPETLLAMLQDELQQERGDRRDAADDAHQQQQSHLRERVESMRSQATWALVGGLAQGVGGIASGTLTIVGTTRAMGISDNDQATLVNQRWGGGASLSQAGGQLIAAMANRVAQYHGTNAEEAQQRASDAEHRSRQAQESAKEAGDLAERIDNRLDALENTRHATATLWRA
ncbi:MAG: hypothetical protein HY909_25830 [Deltaproteobacteria bacterium]|nr:hypothetical protein [Deltaproteobacteria bacterium]